MFGHLEIKQSRKPGFVDTKPTEASLSV